jgi:acyl-CoA synthetase (AMP-forming)/AMP-acid ligase II/acyl carrier protein
MPACLERRAALHGDRTAVTFLSDESFVGNDEPLVLTYRQLWERSSGVAQLLQQSLGGANSVDERSGDPMDAPRVLLLYPAGIEFLIAFLGAQRAGCIPVPTAFPRPHREIPRLNSAARDCQPSALLTDQKTVATLNLDKLDPSVRSIPILTTDVSSELSASQPRPPLVADVSASRVELAGAPDAVALLQYTSGSTTDPKGVVVRQHNLMSNLESIRIGFGLEWPPHQALDGDARINVTVSWLPFYHDMGLIGGLLGSLYVGGHCVMLSPSAFLRQPIRWLETISRYRANVSGAPNFAYQLCVDRIPPNQTDSISLASWRLAFCGAEPIAARTLIDFENRFAGSGFSAGRFYPCYGLAEATLLVTGGDTPAGLAVLSVDRNAYQSGEIRLASGAADKPLHRSQKVDLVGCGRAVANTQLAVVDLESGTQIGEDRIGEIWVRGDGVTAGYWADARTNSGGMRRDVPLPTNDRFAAKLADGESGYFRTGDLGFIHDEQLYVTGRDKELVILRGRNLFPRDLESTAVDCVREAFRDSTVNAAAFSVPGVRSESLAIVVELPRTTEGTNLDDLARAIRRAVIDVHDVDPKHIWLVRPASIPLTTSGKVRRTQCRESFLADSIETKHRYDRSVFSEQAPIQFPTLPVQPSLGDQARVQDAIESWMVDWLVARAGVSPKEFCREKPISDFGLDSLTAVELSGETEDWTGVSLTPDVASRNPSVAKLSGYIANVYVANRGL